MTNKVPYEQLWVTAYEFSTKSEEWMNGMPQFHSTQTGWEQGSRINPASSEIRLGLQIMAGLFIIFSYPGLRQPQLNFSDVIMMEGGDQKARPVARIKQNGQPLKAVNWIVTQRGKWWEDKMAAPLLC